MDVIKTNQEVLHRWKDTSTEFGGVYEKHEPLQEIVDLAYRSQLPFKLDFTCVDVVEAADGPVILRCPLSEAFEVCMLRAIWM